MSIRLIQDLHAGISRRDWHAVETAANRLRDDVEKTVAILAGTSVGSLPNDYPLSRLASDALTPPPQPREVGSAEITRLQKELETAREDAARIAEESCTGREIDDMDIGWDAACMIIAEKIRRSLQKKEATE